MFFLQLSLYSDIYKDEKTRKTLDLDLGGAVIIFDEAHNINKLCEETASVSLTLADIALAIQDINAIRSTTL